MEKQSLPENLSCFGKYSFEEIKSQANKLIFAAKITIHNARNEKNGKKHCFGCRCPVGNIL
ncbi:MAG: hypothetical protein E7047_09120 [Lentisphaerae bacterium]|nr:hypothetical protein [Lentisphaerota bacterium]